MPLPPARPRQWFRLADTTLLAPEDATPAGVPIAGAQYRLGPHGIVVFEAR